MALAIVTALSLLAWKSNRTPAGFSAMAAGVVVLLATVRWLR